MFKLQKWNTAGLIFHYNGTKYTIIYVPADTAVRRYVIFVPLW